MGDLGVRWAEVRGPLCRGRAGGCLGLLAAGRRRAGAASANRERGLCRGGGGGGRGAGARGYRHLVRRTC